MNKCFIFLLPILTACATPSNYSGYESEASRMYREANSATHPTDEEINSLSYGKAPKNHDSLFKKIAKDNLKDPGSAQFRNIQKPKKFWGKSLTLNPYWLICGEVNAKNSFGGYTGFDVMAVRQSPDGTIDILPLDSGRTKFTFASEHYPCTK